MYPLSSYVVLYHSRPFKWRVIYDGSFWFLSIFDTPPPPAAANLPFTDIICLTCFRVVVLCFCMSTCTFHDVTHVWWFQGCIWKKNGRGRGHPCLSWPGSISFSSNLPDGFEGLIHHYCYESGGEFARTLRADPVQNGYIFDYICIA